LIFLPKHVFLNALIIGKEHLLEKDTDSEFTEYSTTVIRSHPQQPSNPPPLSSILTIRGTPSPNPNETPDQVLPGVGHSDLPDGGKSSTASTIMAEHPKNGDILGTSSIMSIDSLDSYHTAAGPSVMSVASTAMATEGNSTIRSLKNVPVPMVHRFTLLKPGAKPKKISNSGTSTPVNNGVGATAGASGVEATLGWNPFDLFFASGLLVAKCDLCTKRLGWKPVLECDDCGLK
jgi:LIM domain kinase 1